MRKGDEYVLNGTKNWITNGPQADAIVLFDDDRPGEAGTRASPPSSCPRTRRASPAASRTRRSASAPRAPAPSSSRTCACRPSTSARRGGRRLQGRHEHARRRAHRHRGAGARHRPGGLRGGGALRRASARPSASPSRSHQAIQFMLADMATEIDAARLLVLAGGLAQGQGRAPQRGERRWPSCTPREMASRVTAQGHPGPRRHRLHARRCDVERHCARRRITEIYEGTSEIQRIVIAANLLKD